MRLGSNQRTSCEVCRTPSTRDPRRNCKNGCRRKICSSCQPICPCRNPSRDALVAGSKAIEIGRYDRVYVVSRTGDSVVVENGGLPKVERTLDVSALLPCKW